MKKTITLLAILLTSSIAFAQQGFNYKAMITESGTALQNHAISVQFSVIDNGDTLVYEENHDTTSDSNGIILLNIGEGDNTFGDFTSIDWSQEQFLKVEIDTGSGYTDFGITAFKAVPYAKYAENGGGAKKLDDLSDVINNNVSIFIGDGAGIIDEGNNFNVSLGARTLHNNSTGDYNTAIGYEALVSNTSATDNTAIGMSSLYTNTTGTRNVALGMTALFYNSTGSENVAVGYLAGHNSTGSRNLFLGHRAGYFETGDDKLYIENSNSSTPLIGGDFSTDEVVINGSLAIKDGTQGANKVLISDANGKASWQIATTGASEINDLSDAKQDGSSLYLGPNTGNFDDGTDNQNVGVGYRSLLNNSSGFQNNATGYLSLSLNTTGHGNSAFGTYSLYNSTTGMHNTAIGNNTLNDNISGAYNTAVGTTTLYHNTTGNNNTASGFGALKSNIVGTNNTAFGTQAGMNSLGSKNIFLGSKAGYNETGSNKLYIENSDSSTPLIGGDFNTDEVTINGSIAIKDGTQGANKILTSDANGKASWQVPVVSASQIDDLSDAVNDGSSVYIGLLVGAEDDGGNNNIGIGNNALRNNISGDANTASGKSALYANTTGSDNTANGLNALYSNTTGSHNTAFGRSALSSNNIGINNTALGNQTGYNSTGNSNVFIGNQAGYNETGDDMLYIENTDSSTPLIGGNFFTNEVIINGKLEVTEKLTATDSGDTDMKAYIYGSIMDSGGFSTSGAQSDGFSVTKTGTGTYEVIFTNPPGNKLYTVMANMRYGHIGFISVANISTKFVITTYNTSGLLANRAFNFVVYKK